MFYPSETFTIGCEASPKRLRAFALQGTISYKDVFLKPHETKFCFTDGGDLLADIPVSPDGIYHLPQCKTGNSID